MAISIFKVLGGWSLRARVRKGKGEVCYIGIFKNSRGTFIVDNKKRDKNTKEIIHLNIIYKKDLTLGFSSY